MVGNFIMGLFGCDNTQKKYDWAFQSGKELGYEQGKLEAYINKIDNTVGLTQEEYDNLIQYLYKNKIELCYNVMKKGMEARKRMF